MEKSKKAIMCKIIIIGESKVGKTSIISQFWLNKFRDVYKWTIGTDFCTKKIEIDGSNMTLQIWDTAGLERFQSLGAGI